MTTYYFPHCGTLDISSKGESGENTKWYVRFVASTCQHTDSAMLETPTRWLGKDSVLSAALETLAGRLPSGGTWETLTDPYKNLHANLRYHATVSTMPCETRDVAPDYQVSGALFFEPPVPDENLPRVLSMADAKQRVKDYATRKKFANHTQPLWRWAAENPHAELRVGTRGGVTVRRLDT